MQSIELSVTSLHRQNLIETRSATDSNFEEPVKQSFIFIMEERDKGPSIHTNSSVNSNIIVNSSSINQKSNSIKNNNNNNNYDSSTSNSVSRKRHLSDPENDSTFANLSPLECTQSNPLPRSSFGKRRSSNISLSYRRITPDLGNLNLEEQAELEAEITARRAARRASRRNISYIDDEDDDRVIIGTRVSEGHRNYQLMYDMLTGIRIAVGRVSAKIKRELVDEDFQAAHKLVFDITGNELTPGVKYDFKFKDYAPWVFRYLREKFHIDPADYMMSLTNKYILSELGSPGKSGSFFYYSRDYRFIIKTIHHTEHKFMRKVLKKYYEHVSDNSNTLLCRYYGLHRIKLPHGRKIHFVVMGNVFPANKDIHETYDLKGSTFGRLTAADEISKNRHAVLKDLNWIDMNNILEFGEAKRTTFINQLHRDVQLLMKLNIMDYSLLVGVHDVVRGNKEGIRDNKLHIVQPKTKELEKSMLKKDRRESKADIVRKALKYANPVQLNSSELPEIPSEERRHCVFYSEDGGFRSTNDENHPTDKLYYLGVIDILTPYNFVKKAEHFIKSFTQNKNSISAVSPIAYGERFIRFMENAVTTHSSSSKKQQ